MQRLGKQFVLIGLAIVAVGLLAFYYVSIQAAQRLQPPMPSPIRQAAETSSPTDEPTQSAASQAGSPPVLSRAESPVAEPTGDLAFGPFIILSTAEQAPTYTYQVVNEYPHDPNAFTQGLVYSDGVLYEGTGLHGRSSLRRVELETGEVLQKQDLPQEYFGEGIALWEDEIIQLTWQSNVGFIYDTESFDPRGQFAYPTEGWGITHDGEQLIMSDGTSTLYRLDPETLETIGQLQVYDAAGPVERLNELEYIHGLIFANIWMTDRIAIISPDTGEVVSWIDLTGLLDTSDYNARVDVLNGIAYDAEQERLFVTGKLWPKLYEIELVPAAPEEP